MIESAAIIVHLALLAPAQAGAAPGLAVQPPAPILRQCDEEGGDEIVVCGRAGERSPYRLPAEPQRFDPAGPVDSVSRERHRLMDVGASGIGSCSTVGPGGWTGCDLIRWREAHEQYGEAPGKEGVFLRVGPVSTGAGPE